MVVRVRMLLLCICVSSLNRKYESLASTSTCISMKSFTFWHLIFIASVVLLWSFYQDMAQRLRLSRCILWMTFSLQVARFFILFTVTWRCQTAVISPSLAKVLCLEGTKGNNFFLKPLYRKLLCKADGRDGDVVVIILRWIYTKQQCIKQLKCWM